MRVQRDFYGSVGRSARIRVATPWAIYALLVAPGAQLNASILGLKLFQSCIWFGRFQ
jgi:hypothetical protein